MLDVTARRSAAVLSPRELEVVTLLRDGMTVKEIAAALQVSVWTVYGYIASARVITGSRTTQQLIDRTPRVPRAPARARPSVA